MMNDRLRRLSISLGCVCCALQLAHARPSTVKKEISWPTTIQWLSFTDGQMKAAETQAPMLILVYANWCTQCSKLAEALSSPIFVKAAQDFVMVLANHDDPSDGIHHYTPKLSYVPRLFFMKSDGQFWSELTSDNQRYPYYYQPTSLKVLLQNMAKSLSEHRGK